MNPSLCSLSVAKNPDDFVLDVKFACNGLRAAAATSGSNSVVVLEASPSALFPVWRRDNCHSDRITGLFPSPDNADLVFTCSEAGTVACCDVRQPSSASVPALLVNTGGKPVECISVSTGGPAPLLAAGIQEQVLVYDLRTATAGRKRAAGLHRFDDVHTDDVTCVRFRSPSVLLSGAMDGLISEIHLDRAPVAASAPVATAEEPDHVELVLNEDAAVVRMGCFGPGNEYVYALSGSATLSLWGLDDANKLLPTMDLRQLLSSQAGLGPGPAAAVDYVVDCRPDNYTNSIRVVAGGHETGSVYSFILVLDPSRPPVWQMDACLRPPATPVSILQSNGSAHGYGLEDMDGESVAVSPPLCRAADWRPSSVAGATRLLTCSEDGTISLWQLGNGSSQSSKTATTSGHRFHPYSAF